MTALRQRMIDDLKLKGYRQSTRHSYVSAVRQMAEHFHRSPDQINDEELRQYFIFLTEEKKVARSTATIALCAIKFFFDVTLQRPLAVLDLFRPERCEKLPVVLTHEEVRRILQSVSIPVYGACLSTIYSCGLRLQEGVQLTPQDVDSSRMMLHVIGKGGRERLVELPRRTLELLREHWRTHRSGEWLFPAPTRHGLEHSLAHHGGHVTRCSVQSAFARAREKSGVKKRACVHSLRHSYATHLLEQGVNLRIIQDALGHKSPKTTALYAHLTNKVRQGARDPLNDLMTDL